MAVHGLAILPGRNEAGISNRGKTFLHHAVHSLAQFSSWPGEVNSLLSNYLVFKPLPPHVQYRCHLNMVPKADFRGMTPLHWAANRGRIDVARLLVKNGADINKADESGKTPLDLASLWRSPEGGVIMHYAAPGFCYDEVVQLLIDCGADRDIAENGGNAPHQFPG